MEAKISALEIEIQDLEEDLMTSSSEANQATTNLLKLHNTYTNKESEYNELSNRAKKMAEELASVDSIFSAVFARYREGKDTIQTTNELRSLLKRAITKLSAAEVELDGKLHEVTEETKVMVRRLENEHDHDVLKLRSDISQMQTCVKICETKRQNFHDDLLRKETELKELTDICDQLVNQQGLYSD